MITPELIEKVSNSDKVVIVGPPNSGKTTVGRDLSERTGINLICSDDYTSCERPSCNDSDCSHPFKYTYQEALYVLIDDLLTEESWLVEGVLGFRLLRKSVGIPQLKPDLIVLLDGKIYPKYENFVKGLFKIWKDYIRTEKNLPEIIEITPSWQ